MIRGAAALAAVLLLLACDAPRRPEPQLPRTPVNVAGTYIADDTTITISLGLDGEFRARLEQPNVDVTAPVEYEVPPGDCHRVTFETGPPHDIRFTGCIHRQALVGRFHLADGSERPLYLRRWDGRPARNPAGVPPGGK